jgi:DNA-binding transcriptional regulator GbsR (MarR family)
VPRAAEHFGATLVHAEAGHAEPDVPRAAEHFGATLVRDAGRAAEAVAFDRAIVGFFVESAGLMGVPKSLAAIYGVCFASPEPLGFSEIQARLDISAGSISQGLRVLREVGALKLSEGTSTPFLREPRRRERFVPDLEVRNLLRRFIEERLERQLGSSHDALQSILQQLPSTPSPHFKLLKGRAETLQAWHSQARAVLPLVKTFLKLA